ncbi:helix-turn-helix domain-containing protein [Saccharothrix sp. HUAS TT1]|uniref:helix-turn-helix domain-containing protein n=1 Tax=unclassified Saccharothrix TaxID=2593673 RepID=UPI00345B4FC8
MTTTPTPAGVEINGGRVRTERQLLGHNLRAFAEKADISLQYLSQIERGDRQRVSPAVFGRICDALRIPKDQRRQLVLSDAA